MIVCPMIRGIIAAKINHFSGVPVNPNEELVVTCGSTEAMMAAMMAGEAAPAAEEIPVVEEAPAVEEIPAVEETPAVETGKFNIYTTNGPLVKRNASSTAGLPSGIYIINRKKVMIR